MKAGQNICETEFVFCMLFLSVWSCKKKKSLKRTTDSKDISCILQRYVMCFVVKNIICDWLLQIGEMLLVVYKISEM